MYYVPRYKESDIFKRVGYVKCAITNLKYMIFGHFPEIDFKMLMTSRGARYPASSKTLVVTIETFLHYVR